MDSIVERSAEIDIGKTTLKTTVWVHGGASRTTRA